MGNIDIDNKTLTHLLGYLKEKEWRNALEQEETDKEIIKELMKIQDETYGLNLVESVMDDGD